MRKTTMKLADLHKPQKNIRKHSAAQIEEYKRSVAMFGQIRPIVVDDAGEILAGNGLYDAMTGLGYTEADVYIMDGLTATQKKKLMLADNRIFNLGSDDLGAFEAFIADLNGDFDVPGYDMSLLKSFTFDADDVDEQNQAYGRISQNDREALDRAAERYERADEEATAAATEIRAASPEAPTLEMRYLICPKCGEKIWL